MVNCDVKCSNQSFYIKFTNAALVFAQLYGVYFTSPETQVNFQSRSLVCGETVTVTVPAYATEVEFNVRVAYFLWVDVCRNAVRQLCRNVCLLTTGWVFETRCDEIPCNSPILSPTPGVSNLNTSRICTNPSCNNITLGNNKLNNCINNNSNKIRKSDTCRKNCCNIIDASSSIIYGFAMNRC